MTPSAGLHRTIHGRRTRPDLAPHPIRSGAGSFLSGTANRRIEVTDVDAVYAELGPTGVLHPVSRDSEPLRPIRVRTYVRASSEASPLGGGS